MRHNNESAYVDRLTNAPSLEARTPKATGLTDRLAHLNNIVSGIYDVLDRLEDKLTPVLRVREQIGGRPLSAENDGTDSPLCSCVSDLIGSSNTIVHRLDSIIDNLDI